MTDTLLPHIEAALAAGNRIVLLKPGKVPAMSGFNDPAVNTWDIDDIEDQIDWANRRGIEIVGYGIICGPLSRNRFAFDFDHGGKLDQIVKAVLDETGFDLMTLPRVRSGRTSSPGYHLIARTVVPIQSRPVARFLDDGKLKTIVEIVGQSKQLVGPGSLHKSGNTYQTENGDPNNPPLIEHDLLDKIIKAMSRFDELPPPPPPAPRPERQTSTYKARPGDVEGVDIIRRYNGENAIDDVLTAYGYTHTHGDYYAHPNNGESSTSVHVLDGGKAYSFSPNDPIGVGSHDAFDFYSHFEHGGDTSKAIRALSVAWGLSKVRSTEDYSSLSFGGVADIKINPDDEIDRIMIDMKPGQTMPIKQEKAVTPEKPKRRLRIWQPTDVGDERSIEPPKLVNGLVRRGDVVNLVAAPKMKKSWLVHDLAVSLSNGMKWLGTFECQKSRVLIIDNELREWALRHRLTAIMQAKGDAATNAPFVLSLREDGLMGLDDLADALEDAEPFDVMILDALYRLYPEGHDENSNTDATDLYNKLEHIARSRGAAFIVVHHSAKGSQKFKGVTDAGAGAGAQSRAADAQIVVKADESTHGERDDAPDRATLSAVVRDFRPTDRIRLKWNHPCWILDTETVDTLDDDGKPKMGRTTAGFAAAFATDEWESRATIEQRAREQGLSVREARELFEGARDEDWLDEQSQKSGRLTSKLYRRNEEKDVL